MGRVDDQALTLITAGLLGWRVLAAMSTTTAAAVGTLSWLSALPFVMQLGNVTEEYALPLQMGAVLLYGHAVRSDYPRRSHMAGIGALGAALVLLRPNLAGLPAIAALLLVLSPRLGGGKHRRAGAVIAVGTGAMVVFAPILAWLACRSALADFVDAVVRYNLAYSNARWADRIGAIGFGFEVLSPSVTLWLAAVGWFTTLVLVARPGLGSPAPTRRVAVLIVIAAPCEVILAVLPGREYPHYFMSWLPVGAICVATLADVVLGVRWTLGRRVLLVAVSIAVAIGLTQAARQLRGQLLTPSEDRRIQETVDYITREVDRRDTVLVWGAEATVNFLTGCPAPTRFVYQYPLFTSGYTRVELFEEIMADLRLRPPLFVIDASSSNPIIPSLAEGADGPIDGPSLVYTIPAEVDQIRHWIHDNYLPVHRVSGWIILRSHLADPDVANLPGGAAQSRPVP